MLAHSVADQYRYAYLIGGCLILAAWIVTYRRRADLRREMVVMGLLGVLYAVPHEYLIWTRDWWHPPTVTGTRIGIEDVIYAFGNSGMLAVVAALVLRQRADRVERVPSPAVRVFPYAINALVPPLLVLAGLHSFLASAAGAAIAVGLMVRLRPDLAGVAAASAGIGALVVMPVYWTLVALFPGLVGAIWDLRHLSGIIVLGIPIEDLIWYAYTAAFCGTYFKFAAGYRLMTRLSRAPQPRRA